ncbi:MAG TPA: hypothetical protein VE593_05165, partial [Nitrososphaeraceae archaeon]|nr:hypothetical protein [Nitrososphaeraceae archaeon]
GLSFTFHLPIDIAQLIDSGVHANEFEIENTLQYIAYRRLTSFMGGLACSIVGSNADLIVMIISHFLYFGFQLN